MIYWQGDLEEIIKDEPACYSGIWVKGILSNTGAFFPSESSWGAKYPVCDDKVLEGFTQLNPLGPNIRPKKDTTHVTLFINPHLRIEQGVTGMQVSRNRLVEMLGEDTAAYSSAWSNQSTAGSVFPEPSFSSNLFATTNLGWINCDRFRGTDNNNVNLLVELEESDESFLVFKEIRSVMRQTYLKNAIYFNSIPYGEEAVLVTIRKDGEGGFHLAIQDVFTEPGKIKPNGFIKMNEDNLDNAIAALSF
jgi:hypothetical protein